MMLFLPAQVAPAPDPPYLDREYYPGHDYVYAKDLMTPGSQLVIGRLHGAPFMQPPMGVERLCVVHIPAHAPDSPKGFYTWTAKEATPITSLNQLQGLVRIDSRAKALEFVRLSSEGYTSFFLSGWDEIRKGDCEKDGQQGMVKSPAAVRFASHYPVVQRDGRHFLITRLVMVRGKEDKDLSAHVEVATEDVGPAGEYKMVSSVPLAEPAWFVHIPWEGGMIL